jgi:pilus assembly protein FimV
MQARKIVIAISAAIGLMLNGAVSGAELGKAWLHSGLNQPLNADIELIAPNTAELKHLRVKMGGKDAFYLAHLTLLPLLKTVRFHLDLKPDGSMVVHLSSDQPVTTPVLDMLIELDWGTGMMLQSYQLSFRPAEMTPGGSQPENAVVNASLAGAVPVPVQQTPGVMAMPQNLNLPAQKTTEQPARGEHEITTHMLHIQSGMTLSGIAMQYLPPGVHLDQMLLALYQENAHAFEGNMNRMQAGRTLRLPDQHELAAINESVAEHAVQIQAEDWHRYRQKLAMAAGRSAARSTSSNEVHGHVVTVMPEKMASPSQNSDQLKLSHAAMATSAHLGKSLVQPQPTPTEKKQMAGDDAIAQKKALKEAQIRAALLEENARNIQKLLALKKQALNENKQTSHVAAVKPFSGAVPALRPQSGTVVRKWYEKINLTNTIAGVMFVAVLIWLKSILHHRKRVVKK